MKKILLATTILGMTAGFAAADISFKGTATVGVGQNGTDADSDGVAGLGNVAVGNNMKDKAGAGTAAVVADDASEVYTSFKLSVAASGETDGGITFGASTSLTSGMFYTLGKSDAWEVGKGTLDGATVFVAGDFGKIQFKANGFKELQDDSNKKYDMDYSGTFGALSVGLRADLNTTAGNTGIYNAATAGLYSVSLGYTVADVKLSAAYDELGGEWGISASKAFGPITATLGATGDDGTAGHADGDVTTLKLAYAADALSASLKMGSDDTWTVAAGYAANGMTLNAETTQADRWTVTAGYDLGGGLTLEAGTNYTNDAFLGARMAF